MGSGCKGEGLPAVELVHNAEVCTHLDGLLGSRAGPPEHVLVIGRTGGLDVADRLGGRALALVALGGAVAVGGGGSRAVLSARVDRRGGVLQWVAAGSSRGVGLVSLVVLASVL